MQLARESAGMFVAPTLARIPNVEVVREASTLLWCRADGREFYVPREQLFGDELGKVGDRVSSSCPTGSRATTASASS
jgi:hypothetical protein